MKRVTTDKWITDDGQEILEINANGKTAFVDSGNYNAKHLRDLSVACAQAAAQIDANAAVEKMQTENIEHAEVAS